MVKKFIADFETTTNENDCRVWAWGFYNLNSEKFEYGIDLNSFFERLKLENNCHIYFHNIRFDGEFMLYYLFNNGFKYSKEKTLKANEFSCLISNMGIWYTMKVNINNVLYTFYDSLKIIPLAVSEISNAFKIDSLKGEIDYKKERHVGYQLDNNEIEYLKNDCVIVGKAVKNFLDKGLDKMTQASNAFFDYKSIITDKVFDRLFPSLYDSDMRESYKGGFTYVNPIYKNKIVYDGIVLDVNSLYPSVMYNEKLPFGEPIKYSGAYKEDKYYKLYIQCITCQFEIKKGYLPTIQLKNDFRFSNTKYLESSENNDITLFLTNVDLELFLEHYNVYNIDYLYGWKFKGSTTLFTEYIDKWIQIKNESTINGNEGMRTIAKLMLNSLYGKFALNPKSESKIPYMDDNGFVRYSLHEEKDRKAVYLPMASFITSYARSKTIRSAQQNIDRFLYADTDSLHLKGLDFPKNLEIDKIKLGAWKHESTFKKGKYIRAKSYIEEIIDGETTKTVVRCAGLPHNCHNKINFSNFKVGLKLDGKLEQKRVKGGIILIEKEFSIKP